MTMSFIYITGVSGSGKSTVQGALQKRGYVAYDVDDQAISSAFDNRTGKKVTMPPAAERTVQWFKEHSWRMMPEAVERLAAESRNHTVFLCGAARNDQDFWHVFDTVIYLDITEATLRKRIAERTGNDYGKNDHELQSILNWHKQAVTLYEQRGAYKVNADQPLDAVIQEILGWLPT